MLPVPPLPIVFVHRGNSRYLFYSLWQARRWNPEAPIYLLGTHESRHLRRWVTHVDLRDHWAGAAAFAGVYQHHSRLGHDFELLCIQRWFVLRDFMRRLNLERCVALDTDILVYTNMTEATGHLPDAAGMTMTGWSPHTNYVSRRAALEQFCDFVTGHYAHPDAGAHLRARADDVQQRLGAAGVSDMSWFWDFAEAHPGTVTQLLHARDHGRWDNTLTRSDGFVMQGDVKRIEWRHDQPYGFSSSDQEAHRFHLLHFQGSGKKHLYGSVRPQTMAFRTWARWSDAIYFGQRLRKKVLGG